MSELDSQKLLNQIIDYFAQEGKVGNLPDLETFLLHYENDPFFKSEYKKLSLFIRQNMSIWLGMQEAGEDYDPNKEYDGEADLKKLKDKFPDAFKI